ncbi:MAG: hypothetical protein EBR82_66665, partial [Caulobacteraceae bacterium]|nr:hypothetical protein [Caulobacteraceae bacterium]
FKIKNTFQKLIRGYSDSDCWNPTINKSISLSKEEYENVLDEIIFALEFLLLEDEGELDKLYEVYPSGFDPVRDNKMFLTKQNDGNYSVEFKAKDNIQPDYTKLNKAYKRQRNGFLLLGLYFKDLWD